MTWNTYVTAGLMAAACTLCVNACAAEPDAPDELPEPETLDGLWQTEGYGWVYAVDGDDVSLYEYTATSCVQIVSGRGLLYEG